jgi:predicted AAA+ superfamily ATPase
MWIDRLIHQAICDEILKGEKVVVLYGARQTGKTSLLTKMLEGLPFRHVRVNADQAIYQEVFSGRDLKRMQDLVSGYDLLFIDEGQRIPDLGIHLKILHDEMPTLRIVVTGSSSFDLATKVEEPLTGRKRVFTLTPVSQEELAKVHNRFELRQMLPDYLIYGCYPEVLTQPDHSGRFEAIREIGDSYLMKDVMEISQIKHVDKALRLLRLLAFQIGSQVSVNELSQTLMINHETVESYISLFEKAFVIFRLGGFSRNLRNEMKKTSKIYFWDTGIRNYLAANFNSMELRNDAGLLFENFIISERMKNILSSRKLTNSYFWRLYSGAEIDYIEEASGQLYAFEIKWGKKPAGKNRTWAETYQADVHLINRENYLDFLLTGGA